MRDYRFHCEDCDSYSQCQYYHNRKVTSLICKEFQYGSSVIEQIRAEIEQYEVECMLILPMTEQTCNRCTNDTFKNIYQIIDRYTK